MRIKTIRIPIYECTLTVILEKDLNKALKRYKLKDDVSGFGAFTFKDESKYRHYVVAFETDWRANVAHELVHVVNHIYIDCAMKLDPHNDEPQAYLMGWLFEQIDQFLKNK